MSTGYQRNKPSRSKLVDKRNQQPPLESRERSPLRLIRCMVCPKKFATNELLYTHSLKHVMRQSFECDVCGKVFYSIRSKFRHRDRIHGVVLGENTSDTSGEDTARDGE